MGAILGNLEPKSVWNIFEEITKYPRPSKHEEKISAYIEKFAGELGYSVRKDDVGNLVIKKPATPGMESKMPFCIQAHVDMVCEKNRDVEFDFDNDSIQPWIDGDWVKAKGTTLGADNGIGLAMGMAVLASKDLKHPPFELLCTMDEETGLTGAIRLGKDLLSSKILINLDSEEDGHFTIGCAGGLNTLGIYNYVEDTVPIGHIAIEIGIKGLRGGHSGIEINDGRGNSIHHLSFLLNDLSKITEFRLSTIEGGNKHNAIPREAFAILTIPAENYNKVEDFINTTNKNFKADFATKEPDLMSVLTKRETPSRVMAKGMQDHLLLSFLAMPHGVIRMHPDIAGLVQTSTNFAVVTMKDNSIEVLTSQRSSNERDKLMIAAKVKACFELGGAKVEFGDGYPAWEPNINSPILKLATDIYKKDFGKDAVIEAIHAGLECGLVGEKYPGMDMLSFGPTLKEVHTPSEMVQISTVEKCWRLLTNIIENLPENK